jgi:hypothetical protein
MSQREKTAETLKKVLYEPHYCEAPDALAMLDLTPQSLGVEPDSIRVFLHKTLPQKFSKTRRGITRRYPTHHDETNEQAFEDRTPEVHRKSKELFEGRPYAINISTTVDSIARILMALLAGLFLLTPMVALSYINSKEFSLITTCLFVVVFAIVLSLASKASNQEVITATAAYAAVLVVFVGQASTPTTGILSNQ